MKTIKFDVWVSTGYVGASRKDELEIEIEDDATEEEIEADKKEATNDWLWNTIDFGWN